MRARRRSLVLGAALLLAAVAGGCAKDYIRHTHVVGHGYCLYTITAKTPNAPMNVGDQICVWCKKLPPPDERCTPNVVFRTDDGKWQYDGRASGIIGACENCPGVVLESGRVFEEK